MRENILLSRVDANEKEYNSKTDNINKLMESLDKNKSLTSETLIDNELNETYNQICSVIYTKIQELTADRDTSIEFEWDNLLETGIEQLGSIKLKMKLTISVSLTNICKKCLSSAAYRNSHSVIIFYVCTHVWYLKL